MMKLTFKKGLSFGITSAIITTLGLMAGLHSGTKSKLVILGAILTIGIADAFSDALAIHISEESENNHTTKEIWESTLSTFFTKLVFAMFFIFPVMLLPLKTAIVVSMVWGLSLLGIVSFYLAKEQRIKPWKAILEHELIALVVIAITHHVGDWVAATFG